jgi:hypothetical protein
VFLFCGSVVAEMPSHPPSQGWKCPTCGRRQASTHGMRNHTVSAHGQYFRVNAGKPYVVDIPPDERAAAAVRVKISQARSRDRPRLRETLLGHGSGTRVPLISVRLNGSRPSGRRGLHRPSDASLLRRPSQGRRYPFDLRACRRARVLTRVT